MSISEHHSNRSNQQFNLDQIRRILILRMATVGETILTTPVIRALRERFPYAYIAYMVNPGREELVSENPNLNEVITYRTSIPSLIYEMAKRSFDMVVVLQPTFRLVVHTFLARIPFRIGFETNSGKGCLLHAAAPNNIKQHEIERYLDVVRGIGIEPDSHEPEMFVNAAAQTWANDFLAADGVPSDQLLIGLNPGSSSLSRRWSRDGFAEVGDRLHQQHNAQILITAGDAEGRLPHDIARRMSCSPIIVTGVTPMQLGAIIQKCHLYISNDTGPMHISTALRTPTIGLFGASNPRQWGPNWHPHTIIARDSMEEIGVEDVLEATDLSLSRLSVKAQ